MYKGYCKFSVIRIYGIRAKHYNRSNLKPTMERRMGTRARGWCPRPTEQAYFYPTGTKGSLAVRYSGGRDMLFATSEGTINTDPQGHLPTFSSHISRTPYLAQWLLKKSPLGTVAIGKKKKFKLKKTWMDFSLSLPFI